MWGTGNYYSCHPALAVHYDHQIQPGDATLSSHLADVGHIAGMWLTLLACPTHCLSHVLRHFHPRQACMRITLPFTCAEGLPQNRLALLKLLLVHDSCQSCFQTHVFYRSLIT